MKELNFKINFALLKKSKAFDMKNNAEDKLLDKINVTIHRGEIQAAGRRKMRKSNIVIKPLKIETNGKYN